MAEPGGYNGDNFTSFAGTKVLLADQSFVQRGLRALVSRTKVHFCEQPAHKCAANPEVGAPIAGIARSGD